MTCKDSGTESEALVTLDCRRLTRFNHFRHENSSISAVNTTCLFPDFGFARERPHEKVSRFTCFAVCAAPYALDTVGGKGVSMTNQVQTTRILGGSLLLALVTIAAVSMLPDLVRYMKIRSM